MTADAEMRYEQRVKQLIREGRGGGILAGYRPWITVRSLSSKGHSYRVDGKTGRTHHFLSSGEFKIFTLLNGSSATVDIREQFPLLPLKETVAIAQSLDVPHPRAHPGRVKTGDKINVVMTTDFVVDLKDERDLPAQVAISVKSVEDLDETTDAKLANLLNKAEIERRYWRARKVRFLLVTPGDVPQIYLDNMIFLHKYRLLHMRNLPAPVAELSEHLLDCILTAPGREIRAHCKDFDRKMKLDPGTGLSLVWHNVATKAWMVDLLQPLLASSPLPIQVGGRDREG